MPGTHDWRRRQAVQIVSQLPDNTGDALAVLEHARELILGFLEEEPDSRVKTFPVSTTPR